ncbi:MAG TPA: shikimate kinase [bacterium]|nr:shikimate kinase [bacterium]HOL35678.1 shikimate kinase [bacterium]HPP07511.1 shikimate kinase [bacterium]
MKIVLAGFNGTWRKEAGHILSMRLGREFFDIEQMIEEKENDRIAHISQIKGAIYVRDLESSIIKRISVFEHSVISVGPDVIADQKNRLFLKSNGIIIWFTAEPSVILLRLHPGKEGKALLKKQNAISHIRQILKEHDYSCFADKVLDTSFLTPEETADQVQQMLASF